MQETVLREWKRANYIHIHMSRYLYCTSRRRDSIPYNVYIYSWNVLWMLSIARWISNDAIIFIRYSIWFQTEKQIATDRETHLNKTFIVLLALVIFP